MDKITKSLLDTFSNQYELNSIEEHQKFEHFSNFSIISKLFRGSFELEDIHSGSGGDCGIDGIFLIVNGRLILDEDELNDVVEDNTLILCDLNSKNEISKMSFILTSIENFPSKSACVSAFKFKFFI